MENFALDDDLVAQQIDPNEVEYAGFWRRFAAMLIDLVVTSPLIILALYNVITIKSFGLMLLLNVLMIVYKPLLEWKFGATVGKLATKIKVVSTDFKDINSAQALKRYYPWIISYGFQLITNLLLFESPDLQSISNISEMNVVVSNLPFETITNIYSFIFIAITGKFIFDKKKQGAHDKYARTLCIKVFNQ